MRRFAPLIPVSLDDVVPEIIPILIPTPFYG